MSWFKGGDKMTINGAVVTQNNTKGDQTTYGMTEVSEGMAEWRIKVGKDKGCCMYIGIASNTNYANGWFADKKGGYALYGRGGYLYSKDKNRVSYANGAAYYAEGDTITVRLNMEKGTLAFRINERECGTAFTDIPTNMKYRIAVHTLHAQTKFEMISNEEREEKKK
eukprot:305180_1